MLLCVDIGNSTVTFAVLEQSHIIYRRRFKTPRKSSASVSRSRFKRLLRGLKRQYTLEKRPIVCSVVPEAEKIVKVCIKRVLGEWPVVVGRDIFVPIKNNYYEPARLGQDRLVCAYAAKVIYGYPCIIADFGTAITFDFVNKAGEYEGGLIIPGIHIAAESLYQKTALLPNIIKLKEPKDIIGRNTKECIMKGIFLGYKHMCRGIINSFIQKAEVQPYLIVTGGDIGHCSSFFDDMKYVVDEDLIFKGMSCISQ